MPRLILSTDRLKRVSQAKREVTQQWKEGVSLESAARRSIQQLLCIAAADRWHLASTFRSQANKMISQNTANYRSAISRYYYSMYHAMRASVFIDLEGDDHEEHSKLPLKIPSGFDPAGVDWQNKLKDARLLRNRADYDSYPKTDKAWQRQAIQMKADADMLLNVSRAYLLTKGCNL